MDNASTPPSKQLNQASHRTPQQQAARLKQLMQAEIECYRSIETDLEQKKQCILNANAIELNKLDHKLAILGQKAKEFEQERLALQKALGKELGLSTQTAPKLVDLIPNITPAEDRIELLKQRDTLTHLISDIQRLNQNNHSLLELSLKWISETLTTIHNALAPEGAAYDAGGKKLDQRQGQLPLPSAASADYQSIEIRG